MPRILALALLSSSLLACGSDDAPAVDAAPIDAALVDAAPPDVAIDAAPPQPGTYITSALKVPRSASEASQLGLDIDDVAGDANGGIDNQFGTFLASLGSLAPELQIDVGMTAGVDRGDLLLLARYMPSTAPFATMLFILGADPQPPACASPTDAICRRHLDGFGSFRLSGAGGPTMSVTGELIGTRFVGDRGSFVLPMTFSVGGAVALVPVTMAAMEVDVGAAGLTSGKLGGAIRQTDVEAIIHPAMHARFAAIVARDCPAPGTPPSCNCASGSTGASMLGFLDTQTPRDCQISVAEVTSTLNSLLTTDIDTNGDGQNDAVSIGVGYTAVPATIRP